MSDFSQRFLFEDTDVRGELVELDQSFAEVLAKHAYPEPVAELLGEMLAAVTLLSDTLKFEGLLVLQARSAGPRLGPCNAERRCCRSATLLACCTASRREASVRC